MRGARLRAWRIDDLLRLRLLLEVVVVLVLVHLVVRDLLGLVYLLALVPLPLFGDLAIWWATVAAVVSSCPVVEPVALAPTWVYLPTVMDLLMLCSMARVSRPVHPLPSLTLPRMAPRSSSSLSI
jgi:hypothetical protein